MGRVGVWQSVCRLVRGEFVYVDTQAGMCENAGVNVMVKAWTCVIMATTMVLLFGKQISGVAYIYKTLKVDFTESVF